MSQSRAMQTPQRLMLLCALLLPAHGLAASADTCDAGGGPCLKLNTTVFMSEMSWYHYTRRVTAGVTVLLPVGSTEQHGPHLPLGVDTYIATGVAQRVAQEVGAVVAPTLSYGYKSVPCMGGGPYNGTTGLDGQTLTSSLRDIIRELVRHGVRRVLVLDGHFENQMFSIEAVNLAQRDAVAAGITNLQVMRLEYWDHVKPETTAKVFPNGYPGAQLEHAAVQETSLMLVLQPQLVDLDAIPGAGRWPADRVAAFPAYTMEPDTLHPEWAPFSGVLSPANAASVEKGEWLMADHVAGIAAAMRAEWGSDVLAGLKK